MFAGGPKSPVVGANGKIDFQELLCQWLVHEETLGGSVHLLIFRNITLFKYFFILHLIPYPTTTPPFSFLPICGLKGLPSYRRTSTKHFENNSNINHSALICVLLGNLESGFVKSRLHRWMVTFEKMPTKGMYSTFKDTFNLLPFKPL